MKKRLIAIMLIIVMLMSSIVTYADKSIKENAFDIIKNQVAIMRLKLDNVESFVAILKDLIPLMLAELKDVKESDWFKDNLALLFGMKIVEGNEKNEFMPNKEVTGSEYLKMVVVALDNKNYAPVDGSWDKPYIDRALELGLVKKGEITDYRKPLNRYNMARIIVRACKEEYGDYNQYQGNIKDFNSIPTEFREYVLKAYSKGIINGYTDGTFGGEKTMRRSEATAVIARLIDPSQRVTPEKPVNNDFIEPIFEPKFYTAKNEYGGVDVDILVKNYKEYWESSTKHQFKAICTNYPQIEKYWVNDGIFPPFEVEYTHPWSEDAPYGVYQIYRKPYYIDKTCTEAFYVKPGMVFEIIVYVKKGEVVKEYPITIEMP